MINTLQIGNLILGTLESGYLLGDSSGFASPSLKVDVKERGSSHGADLGKYFYGRRVFSVNLGIVGKNVTDYEDKRRALESVFDISAGLKRLTINTRSGISVYSDVIVTGELDLPYKKGSVVFSDARIELTAPFPFLMGVNEKVSIINVFSGGGFEAPFEVPLDISCGGDIITTLDNLGNTKSFPIITLYGELEDPTILNETNGDTFTLDYSIANGSNVKIDVYNRTVILNDTTNIREYFSGDWLTLESGINGLKLVATVYGENSKVFVNFRDCYLGI